MINFIKRFYYTFKLLKEMDNMDVIYATLIVKGFKTFDEVPGLIQDQVAEALKELDAEHLITRQE